MRRGPLRSAITIGLLLALCSTTAPKAQTAVASKTKAHVEFLASDRLEGREAGTPSERLAGDSYFPVCSPKFRRGKLPTKPSQLAGLPLFRNDPELWEKWFAAAGVPAAPAATGIDYNDAAIFLQQAIAGEGIALTRRSLIGDDFANGKLVRLFDIEIKSENDYHLVCLPQNANSRKVSAFRDWVLREIDWPQN